MKVENHGTCIPLRGSFPLKEIDFRFADVSPIFKTSDIFVAKDDTGIRRLIRRSEVFDSTAGWIIETIITTLEG